MGFLIETLIRLLAAPFVFGWRRLRARSTVPADLQASLADDMRAAGLIDSPPFDAIHDRIAQDIIRDARFRPSISQTQALELLFVALDEVDLVESSEEAAEAVAAKLSWRVNSGNLR